MYVTRLTLLVHQFVMFQYNNAAMIHEPVVFKSKLSDRAASAVTFVLQVITPLLPLVAALLFWKKDYVLNYQQALKKIKLHVRAISVGPMQHYFQNILFFNDKVSEPIAGHCSQCGNCCLNRQCFFLEQSEPEKYICGIYNSPLRRFSNCSSFPINGHDIERYQCPTYSVIRLHSVG
jgi:hypothetical protein